MTPDIWEKAVLLWTKRCSVLYTRLSSTVIREICEYLGYQPLLPVLRGTSLCIHNLQTGAILEVHLGEDVTGAVCCLASPATVLCVGGIAPTRRAVLVHSHAGIIATEMKIERRTPGLVLFSQNVFVFGGNLSPLTAAEKYDIETRKWTRLADMGTAKVGFCPCVYQAEIYLPESSPEKNPLEVYIPAFDQYRQLPLTLASLYHGSVSFILQGELTLINLDKKMYRWRIEGGEIERASRKLRERNNGFAFSPPLHYEGFMHWPNNYGRIVKFDLRRKVVIEPDSSIP